MEILIVYDSYFGNTETIARALCDAVQKPHVATMVKVQDFSHDSAYSCDLLVIGSPTRAFRPTKAIVDMIRSLPSGQLSEKIRYAVFDTRVSVAEVGSKFLTFMVSLFGYAAEPMDKIMKRRGFHRASSPIGFIVEGQEGPLKEGEAERAAYWMRKLIGN